MSSVITEDKFVIVGEFVCDHNREWVFGFSKYLSMCTVVNAELWDIPDGLKLTLQRDYGNMLILTNSFKVVTAIQDVYLKIFNLTFIRKITNF